MARAIWSGAISFGLVTVPVKLFSATESKTVHFNQFEEGTGERIRYKRVAEGSGEEVDYADIVKGYEIEKGRIDIEDFVSLDEIDPVYFDKTYYLAPAPDVGAEKPYALLHEALRSSNKVAVARFVMRTKQYLAAIRPVGDLLALDTMFFPDEVRGEDTVENAPGDVELSDRELAMAEQLIDSLTSPWEPDRYTDTYRERVLDLIERKAKGEDIVVEEQEATPEVADLMAALQASVEEARNRKAGKPVGGRGDGEGAGLDGLTKDELYERASDAGIEGRSKMSKDELADALRREAS
jgi:DNA end-binding protein Ku